MLKTHDKIIKPGALSKIKSKLKGKKTVLVGGCFDIIHYGHLVYLQSSKERGDSLIVALESDEFILKRKKRNPVHTQEERAQIIASFPFVDYVILLPFLKTDKQYFELVLQIAPSIIAITKGDPQIENKKKQAAAIGASLKIVCENIKGLSSSKIIKDALISSN